MAKIPGAIVVIIGIGLFIVTAYAQFEKTAKTLFTVISALFILYGIGSLAMDISRKKREAAEKPKKHKFDFMPQSMPEQHGIKQPKQAQAQAQRQVPAGAIGFCSVCGAIARADDNFCGKCGARLR